MTVNEKQCSKCKNIYPATTEYFNRDRKATSGFSSSCKGCESKRHAAYYIANQTAAKTSRKRYYLKNKKRMNARSRLWARTHKEQRLLIDRSWKKRNPDKLRANNARRRSRKVAAKGRYTDLDVHKQLDKQKGICYWCPAILTKYHVDHKVPLSKGGSNYPRNIVCACPPCNLRKNNKMPAEWKKICAVDS
jgi:5-methylcytosine-specific restriction endonuclease McrA